MSTFADLGIDSTLCMACQKMGWNKPTPIQEESIPHALKNSDLIGLAETGSGKTGAFALPIIHSWLQHNKPDSYFGFILTPTRELSLQIEETFKQLSSLSGINLNCLSLVGGADLIEQSVQIGMGKIHIIIGTPGRIVDHLENTRGFERELSRVKHMVLDEADLMLSLEFEEALDKILKVIPRKQRHTQLFSASITTKVSKLQRAALKSPVTVEVCAKYTTAENLTQYCLPTNYENRELLLDYLINVELDQTAAVSSSPSSGSILIFCKTCVESFKLAFFLRNRFRRAIPLNSRLTHKKRLSALEKFKNHERDILIATDVASRGLDIPHVKLVVNFDVPATVKTYLHRVGRTARAGRGGKAVTFVTLEEQGLFACIESKLGNGPLPVFETENVNDLPQDKVLDAVRLACKEVRELRKTGFRKRSLEEDEDREIYATSSNLRSKRSKNKS